MNINSYLAETKGWTLEYASQLNRQVTQMAAQTGLTYNLDSSVVANSFNAHRFSHFAKKYGLGPEAEELLFKAYFTDGKNIDDPETLIELGSEIGLDAAETKEILESGAFAAEVKQDIDEAKYLGIQGVPFFVFNNKYAVSGAQAVPVFEEALIKAFAEWGQENLNPGFEVESGISCGPEGNC